MNRCFVVFVLKGRPTHITIAKHILQFFALPQECQVELRDLRDHQFIAIYIYVIFTRIYGYVTFTSLLLRHVHKYLLLRHFRTVTSLLESKTTN